MGNFRLTQNDDILEIMTIIDGGKAYLKSQNVNQWQNGVPNEGMIVEDVKAGYGYVMENIHNEIVATASLSFDGEPWYEDIQGGNWLSTGPFLVIHRMAVREDVRGTTVASDYLALVQQLAKSRGVNSIKIDTHPENIPMQKLLEKNGYTYCGTVILGKEGVRYGYEKLF